MKQYIVYDSRALVDTDDAHIYTVEDTLEDAIKEAKECNGVVFSYDVDGKNLINETFEKSLSGEK